MKNILITGGAGGIGSSISKKFLEAGFEVYSLDLVEKDLGKHFHNIVCDVTSIEELAKVKESLADVKFSHIITLAGRALSDEWMTFKNIDINSITNSITLNLSAHWYVLRTFLSSLDDRDEKMNYKIRESVTRKIPITVIIGDKEKENGNVSFRRYKSEETITVSKEDFVTLVRNEIINKK